jgi:hypothetical protein
MGRLFVGSLHITVDGPRQSAPAITREWAEPETVHNENSIQRFPVKRHIVTSRSPS